MLPRYLARVVAVAMVALTASAALADALNDKINNAWNFAAQQVLNTSSLPSLTDVNGNVRYPSSTTGGYATWNTTNPTSLSSGWNAAFFPGQLWLVYNHTKDNTYQELAKKWTYPLQYSLRASNGLGPVGIVEDHDAGFQTSVTWGNGLTYGTDPAYTGAAAKATYVNNAAYLNSRFIPSSGMIRSLGNPPQEFDASTPSTPWPTYPNHNSLTNNTNNSTVIDHLMGLKTLFEAYKIAPSATTAVFYQNAITDAVNSAERFVRSDGSSYHAVWHYDPTHPTASLRGKVAMKGTVQGYANESTWSRGHAWAIYGFADSYNYTRDDATQIANGNATLFLETARIMADYFWDHLPANLAPTSPNYRAGDYVPPSDFNAETGENTIGSKDGKKYFDADSDASFNETNSGTHSTKGTYTNDRFNGLPTTYTLRDSAAAAIAASAMLHLAEIDPDPANRAKWLARAAAILDCLLTPSSTANGSGPLDYFGQYIDPATSLSSPVGVSILLKYTGRWTDTAYASSSYGDYYLLESMTRYQALVPEPSSLAILALGAALMLRRRRAAR